VPKNAKWRNLAKSGHTVRKPILQSRNLQTGFAFWLQVFYRVTLGHWNCCMNKRTALLAHKALFPETSKPVGVRTEDLLNPEKDANPLSRRAKSYLGRYLIIALAAWHGGHRFRLQNRRSRVRIPPGCKVFRVSYKFQC
jgi:hypothetical protein